MGLCPTLRMTQKNRVSAVVPLLCTSQCESLLECSYLLLKCHNRRVCLSLVTSGGCFEQRACSTSFLPQHVEHRLTSTDRLIIFSWLVPRTGKYTRYVFGGWDCCSSPWRGQKKSFHGAAGQQSSCWCLSVLRWFCFPRSCHCGRDSG